MKKITPIIVSILMSILVPAGCITVEVTDPGSRHTENIGLKVTTTRASRAAVSDINSLKASGFRVFATGGGNTSAWYPGIDGANNHVWNGSWWNFASPVLWPTDPSGYPMNFYAWHPASPTGLAVTAIPPNITAVYTVPQSAADQQDLLWDHVSTVVRPASGNLSVYFRHLLSKIDITTTFDPGITSFDIIDSGVGKVGASRGLNLVTGEWTTAPASYNTEFSYGGDPTDPPAAGRSMMLVPQSAPVWVPATGAAPSGAYLYITYRMHNANQPFGDIKDEVGYEAGATNSPDPTRALYVKAGFPLPVDAQGVTWIPGKGYTYNISLGSLGFSNGYLLHPTYFAEDGTDTGIPVRDGRRVGEPLNNGVIRISVDVGGWGDNQSALAKPTSFHFTTASPTPVSNDGGTSEVISVVLEPQTPPQVAPLRWKVAFAQNDYSASDGRTLKQHFAQLVDQNGDPFDTTAEYSTLPQFKVVFPKVYYPNRQIPISATVTVTLNDIVTKSIEVNQLSLTPRPIRSWNISNGINLTEALYGAITGNGSYFGAYLELLRAIPGYQCLTDNLDGSSSLINYYNNYQRPIPNGVNYLHLVLNGALSVWDWGKVNTWRAESDGLLFLQPTMDHGLPTINAVGQSITKNAGYEDAAFDLGNINHGKINDAFANKKVYKYLMENSPGSRITANDVPQDFYRDGYSTFIRGGWPASAVPVIVIHSGTHVGKAMMIIDVEKGFVYLGDSQTFQYNYGDSDGRRKFLKNFMLFVENTAAYGSHFTELLLENNVAGSQPAPWDGNYWGDNAKPKIVTP